VRSTGSSKTGGSREEIESVAAVYEIDKYVTYMETQYIDKQEILKEKFAI
jgi:hypothetical protein